MRQLRDKRQNSNYQIIPILLPGSKDADFAEDDELFARLKLLLLDSENSSFSEVVNLFKNKQRVDFRVQDGIDDDDAFHRLVTGILGELPFPEGRVSTAAIRRDALKWIEKGKKDKSILYSGTRLREAQKIAEEAPDRLKESASRFLEASALEEQRSKRTQQILAIIFSEIAIFAIVAAILATMFGGQLGISFIKEEEQANIALSRKLADESLTDQNQPDLALLLSVQAYKTSPTFEAKRSLFTSLTNNPYLSTFLNSDSEGIEDLEFSPDGSFLLSTGRDGKVLLWNLKSNFTSAQLMQGNGYPSFAFDTKNQITAYANNDNISLFDTRENKTSSITLPQGTLKDKLHDI